MPLLILLIYPIAEIYAYSTWIDNFGFLSAVFWALFSAVLGITIIKNQTQKVMLSQIQGLTADSGLHTALIYFGAILLVIPGLISDFFGLLLVLPGLRHILVLLFKDKIAKNISAGAFGGKGFTIFTSAQKFGSGGFDTTRPAEREVVDVEPIKVESKNYDPSEIK